ncbi:Hypothetical_protein [Hexamita inflata]|uniref:Hypothetical_protein n=1 Tax=Hexamita inflata TaxID=28002 RepID=A0AA86U800_9EUKA|nr:Hypothetical protein HINF_LOCUS32444 [Hexamita inflata]
MNTVHYRNLQTPANNILVKHHHNHITAMQQLHHQCMLTAYISQRARQACGRGHSGCRVRTISLFCARVFKVFTAQVSLALHFYSILLHVQDTYILLVNPMSFSLGWSLVYQQQMNQYRKDDIQK